MAYLCSNYKYLLFQPFIIKSTLPHFENLGNLQNKIAFAVFKKINIQKAKAQL